MTSRAVSGTDAALTDPSAGDVLGAWWLAEVRALEGFEALTRAGASDALHQARVRVRALRSVASVFGAVFDRDALARLERPLAGLGAVLGAARDAEVREQELRTLRDAASDAVDEDELRTTLGALDAEALAEVARTTRDVLERLDSAEHATLMARAIGLVTSAPGGPAAGEPAASVVRAGLGDAAARVADRRNAALRPLATLGDLHALRKASRRLRYAAEASGPSVAEVATTAEAVQNALGDHRDGVLLADELRARSLDAAPAAAAALVRLAEETDARARATLSGVGELLVAVTAAVSRLE